MTQIERVRKKAYVETYGCQMNVSDGELMQGILAAGGYDIVMKPEDADVVLVNTCAIRDHAEQRVIGRVGELYRLKTARPDMVIGVTGCMAQRLGERLLERAAYVDLVMGPDGYRGLPETLGRLRADHPGATPGAVEAGAGSDAARAVSPRMSGASVSPVSPGASVSPAGASGEPIAPGASARAHDGTSRRQLPVVSADVAAAAREDERIAVLDFREDENYEGLEMRRASDITAWVPVQRGCNYRCTYCIVPYVRGAEKNRAAERIIDEVRGLADRGITEVTLLGQTVNSWEHGDWRFPQLLRAVARVDGIRRVRFTSPHPNDFTADLVEVMASEPNVCRQLHLPVQSGHNRTLKRMLRRYTVEEYLERVAMVRSAVPGIALSTDIIVAFPGETDEEYEATLDLVREVRYDDAFLYKYSPREGTPATRLPEGQFVAADIAQERLARLIDLHREIQAEINAGEVGGTVEVLVERAARSDGDMLGRTGSYKVVAFPGDESLIGRYLHVRLTGTTGATFRGVAIDGPDGVADAAGRAGVERGITRVA
ncbi:MAG TPA: MiaB/RimO family radical SAM methylthiotransferase [Longimicrobiales bacterium]|nr:MiaB/RimO family radical SAM methylthiotransferase [Longimicrobiales bacterium]